MFIPVEILLITACVSLLILTILLSVVCSLWR